MAAAVLAWPASAAAQPDLAGIDLTGAALVQSGKLRLRLSALGKIDAAQLEPAGRGYLCLQFSRDGARPVTRNVCVRRAARSGRLSLRGVDGEVELLGDQGMQLTFLPEDAHLDPAIWSWSVVTAPDRATCPPASVGAACGDRFPERAPAQIRVRRAYLAGCKRRGRSFVAHGASRPKQIALTFDDGPGAYTDSITKLLAQHHAHATFFELGVHVDRRQATMRKLLRQGNEIGNHSFSHPDLGAGGPRAVSEISKTNARIEAATGFRPCLFRAPGGSVGSGLIAIARHAGLSTIQWNVDPNDWRLPGAPAIYARVVDVAKSGSIVLMHDGGGPRSETVAALGPILRTLSHRGYEIVTVSELLGYESVFSSR